MNTFFQHSLIPPLNCLPFVHFISIKMKEFGEFLMIHSFRTTVWPSLLSLFNCLTTNFGSENTIIGNLLYFLSSSLLSRPASAASSAEKKKSCQSLKSEIYGFINEHMPACSNSEFSKLFMTLIVLIKATWRGGRRWFSEVWSQPLLLLCPLLQAVWGVNTWFGAQFWGCSYTHLGTNTNASCPKVATT